MINLLTYPDVTYTGVNIALFNSQVDLQHRLSSVLSAVQPPTNVAVYDLKNTDKHLNYNLSVISLSDIVILQNPDIHHWFTGYVLSRENCYYLEYDSSLLNTIYKVSLRQLTDENFQEVIRNATQRKSNGTLQFLPAQSN